MKKILFTLLFIPVLAFSQVSRDSLFAIWENPKYHDTVRIVSLEKMIKTYYDYKKPDSAIYFGEKIYKFSIQKNLKNYQIHALNLMAIACYDKKDFPKAHIYYERSLKLAKQIKNDFQIANISRIVGILYYDQGYFKRSLEYFRQSLKFTDPKSDLYNECLQHVVNSYIRVKNYDKAVYYAQQSIDQALKYNHKSRLAIYYAGLAEILLDQEKLDKAEENLNIGKKFVNTQQSINYVNVVFSELYRKQGKFTLAQKFNNKVLKQSLASNDSRVAIEAYSQGAKLYAALGQRDKAIFYAEQALAIGKKENISLDLNGVSDFLLKLYEKKGDFKKGFELYHFRSVINDSINKNVLLQYELNQAFDKKYLRDSLKAIANRKILNLIYTQKLNTQRFYTAAGIIAALLLLLLCLFIYKNYINKNKINEIISLQNKDLEIQKQMSQNHVVELLAVIESARDFIAFSKEFPAFTYINNAGLTLLGFDHGNQYKQHRFESVFDKKTVKFIHTVAIPECHANGFFSGEIILGLNRKKRIPVLLNVVCHKDENGNIQQYSMIARDISDLKDYQQKIELQNTQLHKVNKELDQFVYSTSHDLRAPLTSVVGILDILDSEFLHDDPDFNMYLEMIRFAILKTDNIIKNILEYSKNSRLEIKTETINVQHAVEIVLEDFSEIIKKEAIAVSINISQTRPFKNDNLRFQIMLHNAIENAIKFQRPDEMHKKIAIDFVSNHKGHVLKIIDNGIGIEKQYEQKVFEMFFKAANVSGSGLGLYVVKQIADLIEAKVFLESDFKMGSQLTIIFTNLDY